MRSTVEYLGNHGLKYLTVYGFSTENWSRDPDEVQGLFSLFTEVLNKDTLELNEKNVRLRHVGRLNEIPSEAQKAINSAVDLTSDNTGMTLNFAVNYGGRQEILDAVNRLMKDTPSQVDESLFRRYLYSDNMPDVDLLIRTGGDLRVSNFLIWQAAYSEFYFTDVLWPDFTVEELERALEAYSQRQRRFGGD
ncbi:Ditrans,polycis-undecaprenyl-diphosphate synthase ((2E,6E)-farnesyl-diphosphate specific) [subsurface metagenome]